MLFLAIMGGQEVQLCALYLALPVQAVAPLLLISSLQAADDACSLLTQARVTEVLGSPAKPGKHLNETPNGRRVCSWDVGDGPFPTKGLSIILFGPLGQMTPVDRFNNAKKPVNGTTKTPVSGLGDDAYFISAFGGISLNVKKGSAVIQLKLGGFSETETQTMEKNLAREAISRL